VEQSVTGHVPVWKVYARDGGRQCKRLHAGCLPGTGVRRAHNALSIRGGPATGSVAGENRFFPGDFPAITLTAAVEAA
jgi:hypothetical protein